ncbi:mucin-2 [Streptomyces sp. NE06-03C]|uniref:mucin-2 n=1 Tax=Streptomyces sp. NE06-03C TaxID=3028694 RepID=UPI0029A398FF|nr:mucin-2 [Streptomyces sp. NE06-03C]MDX2922120.1 mucin-2 [Streptomyces sp. NE06-03C]
MRTHATAQHTGTDPGQCDVTAVRTVDGTRAYVLLDGIGRRESTQEWALKTARYLGRTAARLGDAEAGLRYVYNLTRDDAIHYGRGPMAAAVVAVKAPGKPLSVAWCGDSRAYLLEQGIAIRLTDDHNKRRVYPPTAMYPHGGNRNNLTSCLGSDLDDDAVRNRYGHPAIESKTREITGPCRLALLSDGAYEPHEDARHDLYVELADEPLTTIAREFVDLAVDTAVKTSRALDPNRVYADNASILLADIQP